MNNTEKQQMNIAIAEAMPGVFVHWEGKVPYISRDPKPNWDHRIYQSCPLLDYCGSLDAMATAVQSQSPQFQDMFQSTLNSVAFEAGRLFCQLEAIHWAKAFLSSLRMEPIEQQTTKP